MQTHFRIADLTIECIRGDISRQSDIDAVVNAANAQLLPGGGVAGAIHRAAGPDLARACQPFAPIEPGQAIITDAFNLPNRYVIHCLGPVYGVDEPSDRLLASCYREALRLASDNNVQSIAFPAISTGAFGYPVSEAANIAMQTIATVSETLDHITMIRFVLWDDRTLQVHVDAADACFN